MPSSLEKRVTTLERVQNEMKSEMDSNQRVLETRLDFISTQLSDLNSGMVLKVEFQPIRSIVYGGVSLVLIAVISALIGMVVVNSNTMNTPPPIVVEQVAK